MQPRNVTARAARCVGMNTIDQPDQSVGQARHADQIPKQAGSEEVQRWLRM